MLHPAMTWTGTAILHVDLDAFFAAVEQLDHPEWRGLPVIVGGSPQGRGVVSTASYEARRYGIHSAMSAARAAQLAPPETIWAHPHFERYQQISAAVLEILRDFTPHVQQVSIDEAYLDVTPTRSDSEDPIDIARAIRRRVAALGVTCSVGVAASKTVAKIASDHDKPDALTVVRAGEEAAFLAPLPVRALGGIGPRTASRLDSFGIHSLGELAILDDTTARQILGPYGPSLVCRARGVDGRGVQEREPVKSVSNERTFAQDLRSADEIQHVVQQLSAKVAMRTRRKGLAGRTIGVKVRFSDFTTRSAQRTLDVPTDEESEIMPVAWALINSLWHPGVGVRLVGVGVSGLDEPARQLDLFSSESDPGTDKTGLEPDVRRRLTRSMDAVRQKFGDRAISRGAVRTTARSADGTRADSKDDASGE